MSSLKTYLILLIGTLSSFCSFAQSDSIMWSTVASQPFNVYEAQGEVVNGKLYTFSGFASEKLPNYTPTPRAYMYNPVANTWTALAPVPAMNGTTFGGVTHAGFATDGTDVYFAGGYTSNATGTGQIFGTKEAWKYIVAENRYQRLPDLPKAIASGQMEYLNGRLHHITGFPGNPNTTLEIGDHYVLDLNNLAAGWTTLAPLPNPRNHPGSALFGGKIYLIGGQHGNDETSMPLKDVDMYDPATNTWTRVADLPAPSGTPGRAHISSAIFVRGNRIVVIGGETHHVVTTNMISAYSPATNTWQNLTPFPKGIAGGVAGNIGGTIYYSGGPSSKTTYKGLLVAATSLKVNFQDAATATPTGWLRDFGQAYGPRTSPSQGTGNTYGWIKRSDNTLLDLTLNGRKRTSPADVLLSTFMHMQGNHIPNFSGTREEGIWEAQVANGNYDVTVSVGDGTQVDSRHFINIEGVPAIVDFVPTTAVKFKNVTIPVTVADGKLTVDAIGGTNTKINYVIASPAIKTLSFSPGNLDFTVVQNGSTSSQSSTLSASEGSPSVSLTKTANSNWLILPASPTTGSLSFNINATGLNIGTYTSTVTASATDYSNATLQVKLTVNPDPSTTTTVTLSPVADAFTRNGSFATQNFGLDTTLLVKTNTTSVGFTRITYLKFTVGDVKDIVGAKVRIYGRNTENTSLINLSLFGVTNDVWTETGINFNNAPASAGAAIRTFGVDNIGKYFELDVTDFVKTQFNSDKIVSFQIRDAATQNRNVTFNSKENSTNRPQLVVITTGLVPKSNAMLFVENRDKFPSNEQYITSRIHFPWTRDTVEPKVYNTNHDTVKIRLHNKGLGNLVINNFVRSNNINWSFLKLKGVNYDSSTAFPLTITPGTFADLTLQFVQNTDFNVRIKEYRDNLVIISNDDNERTKVLDLYGLWQRLAEDVREPRTQEMISAFGFKSKTGFAQKDPDVGNPSKPKGDEIISSYFVRADAAKPVYVIQMAAYHGCCKNTETLRWFAKGTNPTTGGATTALFTHLGADAQTMLPRKSGNIPADGSFSPTTPFGLRIGSKDHSDTLFNPDMKIGIRVWKAIDANGKLIPNEYIIANDYLGGVFTNYDYNDNLYYIKNIRPEFGTAYNSSLGSTPSAVDFDEKVVGTSTPFTVNLQNLGTTYPNGSTDPQLTISSVEIRGENQTEFTASMPALTTLNAQQATTLTVNFNPASQGLKIADLLIHYNNSKPLRIPLYGIAKGTGVTVIVNKRIKSGSTTAVTVNGKTWSAETGFAFDNLLPFTNAAVTSIAGTDEDVLYTREQSSNGDKKPFRYEITLPNGNYVVRLHFAEIFWGAPGSGVTGGPGSRVMSVALENVLRLINLDVAAEVGTATAVIKNIPVTVSDGKLNINFSATVNRPMLCAVEVYSFSVATTSASLTENNDHLTAFARPHIYPNPLKNRFNITFPGTYHGNMRLQITDITGRVFDIGAFTLREGGSAMEVDISKLALRPGVYFLRMKFSERKSEVIKVIVQ